MGLAHTRPVVCRATRLSSRGIEVDKVGVCVKSSGIRSFSGLCGDMEGQTNIPKVRLNNGYEMPIIGLGEWQ
ncbi:hypothetical protein TNCT_697911, partial [Trichonephila clavata]